MTTRLRDALLWTSIVVGLAGAVAALRTSDIPGNGNEWTLGIVAIGFSVLGWLVISRRPALPVGWSMLVGGAVAGWSFLAAWWAGHGLITDPGSLRLVSVAAWLSLSLSPLPWPLVLVAPLVLFPNGRARSRGWRSFLIIVSLLVGVLAVATAVVAIPVAVDRPIELLDTPGISGGTATAWAIGMASTARLVGFCAAVVAFGGVLLATRRTTGLERRQHTTVLIGALVTVATPIIGGAFWAMSAGPRLGIPAGFNTVALLAIPAAITLAVLRYRLFDLGIRSADSTTVAARFSERFDPEGDAHSVLQRLAVVVRDELRLGSIEIAADGLEPVVAGRPDGPTVVTSLDYQGHRVGLVTVTARRGERLADPDHRALERIAHYLAVTVEAIRVSDDLRTTQRALQNAYADERRRVRLDLHDGIGPTLATIRLKLVALRRHLPPDTSIDEIVDQVSDTIREVRRVVEGLQPSVLEDLGLVAALQILIADTRRTSGIDITIAAEAELADIPSHIATTSYRVVAEGLANVIRHSRATTCTIHVAHPEHALRIDIHDDGCGFDPLTAKGMGLRSIASRVTAAGGQSSVTSTAGLGTTISLELPT